MVITIYNGNQNELGQKKKVTRSQSQTSIMIKYYYPTLISKLDSSGHHFIQNQYSP